MRITFVHYLQDKENTGTLNQQAPVKRGPKVNGVRRALVSQAGAKQKVGAIDENKQLRIPAQGHDSNAQIRLTTSGNNSPATPQMHPQNQQMGQAHQGTKVNGQPPRSATTFVVDPSKYKPIMNCVLCHFYPIQPG